MGGPENGELELVACPECGAAAEVLDRFTLASTDGPVEHVKVWCVTGRWFSAPTTSIAPGTRKEAGRWTRNPSGR